MIIGITGQIGSGKTYVCNRIAKIMGYPIFSSDQFTVDSYSDEAIIKQLDKKFKCYKDGIIDKSIIKEKLNRRNIKSLNKIIHPYVYERICKIKEEYKDKIAIIEVPLLFESHMDKLFDHTILVSIEKNVRYDLLKKRSNNNYSFLLSLEKYHYNNKKLSKKAKFILYNNIDTSILDSNIKDLFLKIKE